MRTKVITSLALLGIATTAISVWLRSCRQSAISAHGRDWVDGYSCDVSFTDVHHGAKSYRGRMYVNVLKEPGGLRAEMNYADHRRVDVWRQDEYTFWTFDPDAKTYWKPKMQSTLVASTGRGPVGVDGDKEFLGRDKFNRRDVEKWRITKPDGSVEEYWEDVRLRGCVKSIEHGVTEYEITNIREGKQDAKWFELPSGYREVPPPSK